MWRSLCAPQSGAFTRFHPACALGATAARKPQLSTGPGTLLSPVPLQSVRFHARGCNKLREYRTHSRDEGGQGGFYCGLLRFLSSWIGERAGTFPVPWQDEWITYLPAWPAPGGFPPTQNSAAATRPAPVQQGGCAGHAGICSPQRAVGAGRGEVP